MNNPELINLTVIGLTLIIGITLGAIFAYLYSLKQITSLEEEVDKFRDLYFYELDKWKSKYNIDDYEAY